LLKQEGIEPGPEPREPEFGIRTVD
jgi:hypothetical protein